MLISRRTRRELTADALVLAIVGGALVLWWNVQALAARGAAIDLTPDEVFMGVVGVGVIASCIGAGRVLLRLARLARRRRHAARDGESGTLSIEFLLTFPWVYIMFALVIQFLLIGRAKIVSDFAAWRAARSAVVQIEEEPLFGIIYDFTFSEEIPEGREHRPREAAALVLAQLAPMHSSDSAGWETETTQAGVSPAQAFAETGVSYAPWGYTPERYERRAAWTLRVLEADSDGRRIEVEMGRPEFLNFDGSQYTSAFQGAFDDILSQVGAFENMLDEMLNPDEAPDWITIVPLPWPFPDIQAWNPPLAFDQFGLDTGVMDVIKEYVVGPAINGLIRPLFDNLQSMSDTVNFSNPFAPRQVTVTVEFPYQLKLPLVSSMMQPNRETIEGVPGRYITLRSEVALQSTGTRVGHVTSLISGSPLP